MRSMSTAWVRAMALSAWRAPTSSIRHLQLVGGDSDSGDVVMLSLFPLT